MKKAWSVVLVLSFILSVSGCKSPVEMDKIYFETFNYNNTYNYSGLWANDDVCFYSAAGFYDRLTFAYQNGNKVKLIESNDFKNETYNGAFVPIRDFAYLSTEDNDQACRHFYQYSFQTQSYEKLFSAEADFGWMATEGYIVFQKSHGGTVQTSSLYVYSIEKEAILSVCDDIVEFGIVNNKIRYLTSAGMDALTLYEYDCAENESKKLGEIPVEITYAYPEFNFTKDYVTIRNSNSWNHNKVLVYSLDGSTKEYILPKSIYDFVACENFAYATCYEYDLYNGYVSHQDNGVYRINLSDGSFELIDTVADMSTSLHVVSDDEIYVKQVRLEFIAVGRSHIYKINALDKIKTHLFVF